MINIIIKKDKKGSVSSFIVEGHAQYVKFPTIFEALAKKFFVKKGNYAGFDTICAAVSAVSQTALLGIKEVLDVAVGVEIDEGYLECILPERLDSSLQEKVDIILDTMVLSLKDLAQQYKDNIKFHELEV